jgi:hypothetical protein
VEKLPGGGEEEEERQQKVQAYAARQGRKAAGHACFLALKAIADSWPFECLDSVVKLHGDHIVAAYPENTDADDHPFAGWD